MTAEILPAMSLEQYHKRPECSHSQIEVLIESPPLFRGRFITGEFPREETKAFEVGTICHHCLTNGGQIEDVCAEIPEDVLNADGHRKGAAWKQWSAENAGKYQLKPQEIAPIRTMVDNVRRATPRWLVGDCETLFEQGIRYQHEETGLWLRSRPDLQSLTTRAGKIVIDYKTTRAVRPREFASDAAKFGYHRQAAWYWDAVAAVDGEQPATFLFIAVDKSPAHSCWLYELPSHAIELGRAENTRALIELAHRIDSDQWDEPEFGRILSLDLPSWKYRDDPFELEIRG